MQYQVTIKNKAKFYEEEKENIDIKKIEVVLNEEELQIKNIIKDSPKGMGKLDKLVEELKFNRSDYELINSQEIMNKWKEVKDDIIFNDKNKESAKSLMSLSKYFTNKESVDFFVRNYGLTRWLILSDKHCNLESEIDIPKMELYHLFFMDMGLFDLHIQCESKREQIFELKGHLNNNFDFTKYKQELKTLLEIGPTVPIKVDPILNGKMSYDSEVLQELKLCVEMVLNNEIRMNQEVEIRLCE